MLTRLLCGAALTVGLGLWFITAAEKPETPKADPARAEKIAKIKKDFEEEFGELSKRVRKAESPQEVNDIRTEAKELVVLSSHKAIELAGENPKDDAALAAALFSIEKLAIFSEANKDFEKATAILIDNHISSPKMKTVVNTLGRFGATGRKPLMTIIEKSEDKETKGVAKYVLGMSLIGGADDEEDSDKSEKMVAEGIGYLEQAIKEAPEADVGRSKVAKAAASAIKDAKSRVAIGKPAPDVETKNLDGKAVKISSLKGKVVLLDIWATWCGPCRAMIPHEREMVKKFKDKPFVLVSVSADNELETLTAFLEKEPMPWTHWFDGNGGAFAKAYGIRAFPSLFLIDAEGIVRKKWVGAPGNEVLDKAVEDAVKAVKVKG